MLVDEFKLAKFKQALIKTIFIVKKKKKNQVIFVGG